MTDNTVKRRGRPPGPNAKPRAARTPRSKDPYQLARDYERALADLDRQEAKLRADREALEESTPQAVRQLANLSMKLRKQTETEPEPVPPPPAVVETPPALTTTKPNGKPNGAHAAQA